MKRFLNKNDILDYRDAKDMIEDYDIQIEKCSTDSLHLSVLQLYKTVLCEQHETETNSRPTSNDLKIPKN